MKNVLILGAGLSSTALIRYMLDQSVSRDWKIRLGDISVELAREKIGNHVNGEAFFFNVDNHEKLADEIKKADLVISMLPPKFHYSVAEECVRYGVNMLTASYVSKKIQSLDATAKEKGVLLMFETGVDPGLDHMSAMQVIHRLKDEGGDLIAFESATGGLVAPSFDNNPWRYKFTWAPRNVVLAGAGGARFLHNKRFKYIPYHKIFSRYEVIDIPEFGQFEVYPNRDSLKYQDTYGLKELSTMFRGTIRRPGFCDAWDLLVQLGATDDTYTMDDTENMTYRQFINSFVAFNIVDSVEKKIADYLGIDEDSELMEKLQWLGLFEETIVGIPDLTPAQVLQHILEKKWALEPGDKDMIVMEHQFDYIRFGDHRKLYSTLVVKGDDPVNTAMSKTVGLPLAILSKQVLEGNIKLSGVQIPVDRQVYDPVLKELKEYGIEFKERDMFVAPF